MLVYPGIISERRSDKRHQETRIEEVGSNLKISPDLHFLAWSNLAQAKGLYLTRSWIAMR